MVPVHGRGFVPGGIAENEQLAHAFFFRHSFGRFIEKELKDVGVDAIDKQTEERTALRRDGADDILPDVIAQIRDSAAFARFHPASARPRVTFNTAFVTNQRKHSSGVAQVGHTNSVGINVEAGLFRKSWVEVERVIPNPGSGESVPGRLRVR